MRLRLLAIALLAPLLLTGCDTQPATNVTSSGATLNAKGACTGTYSGSWRYQLRRVGTTTFANAGAAQPFTCNGRTAEVALQAVEVTGLQPSTSYEYRIASTLSDGTVLTYDSQGTSGGTAFDRFTTKVATTQQPVAQPPVAQPPVAPATPVAAVTSAVSDNYKACYNDPRALVRETRTWLQLRGLTFDGTAYAPIPTDRFLAADSVLALRATNGATATASFRLVSGPGRFATIRVDGPNAWGPLPTVGTTEQLAAQPLTMQMVVRSSTGASDTVDLSYRQDPAFVAAAFGTLEFNGPGGRWHVDGTRLATDWEQRGAGDRC
jgi:hypothetical protein